MKELEEEFGTPSEILYDYAVSMNNKEIIKTASIKYILAACVSIVIAAALLFCIFNVVWWEKTTRDLYEKDSWDTQLAPTYIIE